MLIVSILLVNTLVVFWWNAEWNTTLMPLGNVNRRKIQVLLWSLIARVLPVEFHFVYTGQLSLSGKNTGFPLVYYYFST